MKREQVVKWLESKGEVKEICGDEGKWYTLTFKAMMRMKGMFVDFVGEAVVRTSVFPGMVLMTVGPRRGEDVQLAFYFDGCHEDRFENETVTLELL